MNRRRWGTLVAALALATGTATAQQPPPTHEEHRTTAPTRETLREVEPADVLLTLHETNQAEIAAARLALEKGRSSEVKSLARTILRDHEALDRQVVQQAQKLGVDLDRPRTLDLGQAAMINMNREQMKELQSASGQQFDLLYASSQPTLHQLGLGAIEAAETARIDDPELTQLLQTSRDRMQMHLKLANRTLRTIAGQNGRG